MSAFSIKALSVISQKSSWSDYSKISVISKSGCNAFSISLNCVFYLSYALWFFLIARPDVSGKKNCGKEGISYVVVRLGKEKCSVIS